MTDSVKTHAPAAPTAAAPTAAAHTTAGTTLHLPKVVLPTTALGWNAYFVDKARLAVRRNESPRFDEQAYLDATDALGKLTQEHPELAAPLAKKGLDGPFFDGVLLVAQGLESAREKVPVDRRRVEQLSPEDKKAVAEAADLIGALRQSVADLGPEGRAAAKALGRGMPVSKDSVRSVADAVQTFLAGAPSRLAILAEAGLSTEDLDELTAWRDKLDTIRSGKRGRVRRNKAANAAVVMQCLTVQAALDFYRGRARLALKKDPAATRTALGVLPRNPERRKAADKAGVQPAADGAQGA